MNRVAAQPQDPVADFKAIDTDGSGALSMQEARAWAEKNRSDLTHSDADAAFQAAFKELDKNGSGNVELEEYDSDAAARQKAEGKKKD